MLYGGVNNSSFFLIRLSVLYNTQLLNGANLSFVSINIRRVQGYFNVKDISSVKCIKNFVQTKKSTRKDMEGLRSCAVQTESQDLMICVVFSRSQYSWPHLFRTQCEQHYTLASSWHLNTQ